MNTKKDDLYAHQQSDLKPFQFDHQVAACFEDMIRRSVPGYADLVEWIILICQIDLQDRSARIYDLGCSLGTVSQKIKQCLPDSHLIAVDHSAPMLDKARAQNSADIEWILSDIRQIDIQSADAVILNLTLQFIPIQHRLSLLQTIRSGLNPNGFLILAEKIAASDPHMQSFYDRMHDAFKQRQGYSKLEIHQKRKALQNVLQPEPIEVHIDRLQKAGFRSIYPFYQQLNFIGLWAQ